ncbi:ubiquinol-cytochrome c reductase iron-sulfur subunit [Halarchaeum sp. P4]|uniref:QcrA and Rieske domain-containing protein n=1 Tax=Halarchaeum sp. P4 TaxID=3421639 RepID=UPI003EBB7ABA
MSKTDPTDDTTDEEQAACDSCPHEDENEGWMPSIFTAEWRSIPRRRYAQALATVGGLTAVGSLAAPVASLTNVFEQEYTGPIYSQGVHLVDGDGNRVTVDALDYGEGMTVYPATHPGIAKAPTVLVRYKESQYGGETRMDSVVDGYAAYSKVCTHAGCMVGSADENPLVCPCHFGKYDPTQGAAVVSGPPPRPLPQLPITQNDNGELIAIGDFEGPVGAGGE